jgi:hypothetical protein
MQSKLKCQASDPDAMTSELRTATHIGTAGSVDSADASYVRQCAYPDPSVSRALSRGNVLSLFKFAWNSFSVRGGNLARGICRGNIFFSLMLGAIYAATVFRGPLAWSAFFVLFGLCFALTKDETGWFAKKVSPLLHFSAHAIALGGIHGLISLVQSASGSAGGPMQAALAAVAVWVVGTVCGGLVTGAYLGVMARAGLMWNNAFSPLACEDFKGFLRFRIDADGTLTGYFFGCDKVPKQWRRNDASQAGPAGDVRPAWTEAAGVPKAAWRLVDTFKLVPR